MNKAWNTPRIALWGLVAGALYTVLKLLLTGGYAAISGGTLLDFLAVIGGGALGGAALLALVSGLRNWILRAK